MEMKALTVQKTTTGEIRVHHAVLRAPSLLNIIGEARVGDNAKDFPNLALLDELAHLDTQREIASPHSFHKEEVLLASRLAQNLGLGSIDSECLLT